MPELGPVVVDVCRHPVPAEVGTRNDQRPEGISFPMPSTSRHPADVGRQTMVLAGLGWPAVLVNRPRTSTSPPEQAPSVPA